MCKFEKAGHFGLLFYARPANSPAAIFCTMQADVN